MKILIIMLFAISTKIFAEDLASPCLIDPVNKIIFKLAKEVNAACGWSIEKIAEAAILKKCEKAGPEERVKFTSSGEYKKIRFTQMTNDFNTADPFFFCKNKLGYEAYRTQLTSEMTKEADSQSRANYEDKKRMSGEVTPIPEKKRIVNRWKCSDPMKKHLKPRIYTTEQKLTLDEAHSGVEGYACLPMPD
jgi:hypothetical protein